MNSLDKMFDRLSSKSLSGVNRSLVDLIIDEKVVKSCSQLVGAIDQGTSSTKFLLFTPDGRLAVKTQKEHTQIFPPEKVGWHEHDPLEIWQNTVSCLQAVPQRILKKCPLQAVGITNQRETTLAWNSETGVPYYNAIVWDDTRTTSLASDLAECHSEIMRNKTGLPVASYFAGTKVKWLLDNVEALRLDMEINPDVVCFGTIDTWLMYQLTGQKQSSSPKGANVGGKFVTDVTNASRWLFMDLETLKWDQELVDLVCAPHKLPVDSCLPEIKSSSRFYANCTGPKNLEGIPLTAILGDQQAALFGQCAFENGQAKNTYGTGLFLMMNTGTERVESRHGLLTTVAYSLGEEIQDVHYALEGSVSHSGSTIQWLRDQVQLIDSASDSEEFAGTTKDNDGMYLVPAFAGLFAPHWRSDARACMVGMTASHHKGHVCRAALEAAAYQTREVFDAMYADSNVELESLNVDGGATANSLLMQFQADIIGVPVVKPQVMETTSIGAAFAAGLAVGIWKNLDEIRALWHADETFEPSMTDADREKNWEGWKKAVARSLDWVEDDEKFEDAVERRVSLGPFQDVGPSASDERPEQRRLSFTDGQPRRLSLKNEPPVRLGFSREQLVGVALGVGALGFLLGSRRK